MDKATLKKQLAAGVAGAMRAMKPKTAKWLEAQGWRVWYAEIFGQDFIDALTPYHAEAIEWHWESRWALRLGHKPEYLSYFPIWSREFMKSTIARRIAVCDGCLSTSESLPLKDRWGYCLYLSRNREMVSKHAMSIETLLTRPAMRHYYPKLSQVKKNNVGGSKGWRATFFYTESGYVFHFAGLDEGVAGGNIDDVRPTIIIPDDVDGRKDSAVLAENRFNTLTTEILPMAQRGTLTFFAQNLITRFSAMYRIWKGHSRVLTDRKPTDPIPAIWNLKTEIRTVDGIVKDVVVGGIPTWHLFGLDRAQECIDREGLAAFLTERQHEVEQNREGMILQHWNDAVHVISISEFAAIYGSWDIPKSWGKEVFNDWARTKTAKHANVAGILTVSAQNAAIPGLTFLFHPMSFAANTAPEDVALRLLHTISPTVPVNGQVKTWRELFKDVIDRTNLGQYVADTSRLIEARREALATIIPNFARPIIRLNNYRTFRGSHEQSKTGALEIYNRVFGLNFVPKNPGGDGGIDALNLLQMVDYEQAHAFRAGEMGRTNYHVVVEDDPDDEGVETVTPGGTVMIRRPIPLSTSMSPVDLHDTQLLRFQFANCRWRDPHLTITGEVEGEILKINDDFLQGHMMLLCDRSLKAAPLSAEEKAEAILVEKAPGLALETILSDPTRFTQGALAMRDRAKARIRKDLDEGGFTSPLLRAEEEIFRN